MERSLKRWHHAHRQSRSFHLLPFQKLSHARTQTDGCRVHTLDPILQCRIKYRDTPPHNTCYERTYVCIILCTYMYTRAHSTLISQSFSDWLCPGWSLWIENSPRQSPTPVRRSHPTSSDNVAYWVGRDIPNLINSVHMPLGSIYSHKNWFTHWA